MTSNEFVAFLKGLSVGISESPTKEQWDIILKNLKLVKNSSSEEKNLLTEIKTKVDRVMYPLIKKFPGSPPDIYM
jgi:archaellum biogenesis ATPase FlaH